MSLLFNMLSRLVITFSSYSHLKNIFFSNTDLIVDSVNLIFFYVCLFYYVYHCCLVQFSCSVLFDFLWPHGLQHTKFPCPSPTPSACSKSCPFESMMPSNISSSVVPFSSCYLSVFLNHVSNFIFPSFSYFVHRMWFFGVWLTCVWYITFFFLFNC